FPMSRACWLSWIGWGAHAALSASSADSTAWSMASNRPRVWRWMARATSTWWASPTASSCSAAGPRWLADRAVQLRVSRPALDSSWTSQERFDEAWILALLAGRAGGRPAVAGRAGWPAVPPVRAGLVQHVRLAPAGPAPRAFSLAAGLPRRDPGQGGGRA